MPAGRSDPHPHHDPHPESGEPDLWDIHDTVAERDAHGHHDHGEGVADGEGRLLRKVRRRRRRRRSAFHRHAVRPALELFDSLGRLHPSWLALPAAAGVLAVWWFWPWISTLPGLPNAGRRSADEVITTFVEDPQRTIAAISAWRERPGSLLVLQGRPSSQADNRDFLANQGLWPKDERGMIVLTPGCDTVGQIAALQRLLQRRPQPGRLTVVTSPAHLGRTMAIAQILIGSRGWRIDGLPVVTEDNRPEVGLRTLRDQSRAQLLRATGWDPAAQVVCLSRDPSVAF